MICRYCESEMRLDDCDFHFKGCKNNYWVCDNCNANYYQEIRFNKHSKGYWSRRKE